MSTEKRLLLFMVLSLLVLTGMPPLMEMLGLVPRRPAVQEQVEGEGEVAADRVEPAPARVPAFAGQPDGPSAFAAEGATPPADAPAVAPPPAQAVAEVAEVPAGALVLGSADPDAKPGLGYAMRVTLDQLGAGVETITLAHHEAEQVRGRARTERLDLVEAADDPPGLPRPFSLRLVLPPGEGREQEEEIPLDGRLWEVVADESGRLVRPVPADSETGLAEGQEVVFRTRDAQLGVTVTKTYRLRQGLDGFELGVGIESDTPRKIAYRLEGPHGLPIEGEWYTSNFREVFFGKLNGEQTEVETHQANEVVDREAKGDPLRITTLPLKFAGVENQYFAVFFEPDPLPKTPEERVDARTVATAVEVPKEKHKADVSVALYSKPAEVAPGRPLRQAFRVFAGPKTAEALTPFGAEDLAAYRKGWSLPGSQWMARNVITPLLGQIYGLTTVVGRALGAKGGNYGIAIILLTFTVRLMLFPLSRKQAVSAKKMQDLQPHMMALREKYKDDKERIGRETMELYRKYGINPFGGCLLALIQMPIFFGLWQALNNSVALRGASFLWIDNLAAPDQLFPFPFEMPFLGPYFNLLPILVVGLMLVHMQLFSPPAATAEQKQQQTIMKYMMVFMAFMFYRVPSGLGIYFITSSTWAIAERLLLPKHLRTTAPAPAKPDDDGPRGGPGGKPAPTPAPTPGGKPAPPANGRGGWRDKLREKLEEVLEEANKDRTYRKNEDRDADRKRRPRSRPDRRR